LMIIVLVPPGSSASRSSPAPALISGALVWCYLRRPSRPRRIVCDWRQSQ
jgi:hypothetical protein